MKRKIKLTRERVLEELCAIGFARATDYMTVGERGLTIRRTEELPPGSDAAIASMENASSGIKLKFYDKMKALELLGKVLGMFEGDTRQETENNLLEAILQSTSGELDTEDLPEVGGRKSGDGEGSRTGGEL